MKIPVDEGELVKVYEALATGDVKILKRGWFNPSFFVGVHEDDELMRKWREDNKYKIRDREVDGYPEYEDLFPTIREQVKKIALQMSGTAPNKRLP